MTVLVNVDIRCLQDVNYAQKGIGQHTLYLLSILFSFKEVKLVAIADPLLGPVRQDVDHLFGSPGGWIHEISGDIYFNPSPLTHDTAPLVVARENKMKTCAVIHDFIPYRVRETTSNPEALASYQYLVNSLNRYDALFPNSLYTGQEIQKFLVSFAGLSIPVHCRSRFQKSVQDEPAADTAGRIRPSTLKQIETEMPYIFVATADDPRKNPEIAIQAALELRSLGLRLVVGGGLSELTRKRLLATYPDQFLLGEPVFLPRLTDAEMRQIYLGARLVLVGSHDEGFSLPVAEAIALGCVVVASDIPAHNEQIKDSRLLFMPLNVRSLMGAVTYALRCSASSSDGNAKDRILILNAYVDFNYGNEVAYFKSFFCKRAKNTQLSNVVTKTNIIGPGFDLPTGIAIFNSLMVSHLKLSNEVFDYVDVDAMNPTEFYTWLFENQDQPMLYVMGNNNVFHSNCFVAMQNAPGVCILHDSRMFEFLLNRYGPHYIHNLWQQRIRSKPISIDTVIEWQRERRLLPDSFLDPIVTRSRAIIVHNQIAVSHIREKYNFKAVHYLPFALQMTDKEVGFVLDMRTARQRPVDRTISIVMLGETEPTKGCAETVFAIKLLTLQGFNAQLYFVGKSDEPYHSELARAAEVLKISNLIHFSRYVSRQGYLDSLVFADIIVQLRYPMFGQVSGPLADSVACGVPVVTTEDLAIGMGLADYCQVIANRFSPLHIAEGIRYLVEINKAPSAGNFNSMKGYANKLMQIYSDSVNPFSG